MQNTILNVITEFCTEFKNLLEGQSHDLTTNELNGGARISFVFHESFNNAVMAMDPFDQIKEVDIRTILYNSSVRGEIIRCGRVLTRVARDRLQLCSWPRRPLSS